MGTQTSPPPSGAGAQPNVANSGWDTSFNASLTANTAALIAAVKCDAPSPHPDPSFQERGSPVREERAVKIGGFAFVGSR
jgi:hypothetical protein